MRFLLRPFIDFQFFDYAINENVSYLKNPTVITRLGHQELPKNPGGTSRCDINKRPFLGEPYICTK